MAGLLESANAHPCPTADWTRTVRDGTHATNRDGRSGEEPNGRRRATVWDTLGPHAARSARSQAVAEKLTASTVYLCAVAATQQNYFEKSTFGA